MLKSSLWFLELIEYALLLLLFSFRQDLLLIIQQTLHKVKDFCERFHIQHIVFDGFERN